MLFQRVRAHTHPNRLQGNHRNIHHDNPPGNRASLPGDRRELRHSQVRSHAIQGLLIDPKPQGQVDIRHGQHPVQVQSPRRLQE